MLQLFFTLLLLTGLVNASDENPLSKLDLNARNFGQNYMICAAYYDVASGCIENSNKSDLSQEYKKLSDKSALIGLTVLSDTTMNNNAQKSFYKISKEDILKEINSRCENISIIMDKYSSRCEDYLVNFVSKSKEIFEKE